MFPYTKSETTVKKYTIGDALASAKRRCNGKPVCVNALRGRDLSEKITLVELNKLSDEMTFDTQHWD